MLTETLWRPRLDVVIAKVCGHTVATSNFTDNLTIGLDCEYPHPVSNCESQRLSLKSQNWIRDAKVIRGYSEDSHFFLFK